MKQTLEETLIDDIENEELSYRYEITSYGADYPVDSIIKRIKDEVIYVPPFQRKFVWSIEQASKFVESLILGLPVPGVFLSKESKTPKLLIVDGQQRLLSLFKFYEGFFKGKEFKLTGLKSDLEGKKYKNLDASDKIRLDDSIIHATIIRQDQPDDEESSIYLIFERLNTGGKLLTPQEIRACIYYGEFNELLNTLKDNPDWRKVFGVENDRLKEQELILRFFALFYERTIYQKPLKSFLNKFMAKNRDFEKYSKEDLTTLFTTTIKPFSVLFGTKSFRIGRSFNAAAFDAIMVGFAERLKKGEFDYENLIQSYNQLIQNETFIENTKGGTSDESSIEERIKLAIKTFDTIL
jgi:uncharacterized protein with ParB-like and HNH nuclease domain